MPQTGNLTLRTDIDSVLMMSDPSAGLIAELLYPSFEVPDIAGRLGVHPLEDLFNTADDRRKSDGKYNRISSKYSDDSYATEERGLEELLDDRKSRVYGKHGFNFEADRARRLNELIRRNLEVDVRDSVHHADFAGATNTLDVTNEWDDAANAVPIDDIQVGIEAIYAKSGMLPDTLQITQKQHWDLSNCDQILDRIKYTSRPEGVLNTGILASALKVQRIVVGNAVRNTADQGQAASLATIWDDEKAALLVTPGRPGIDAPGLGRILYYLETPGANGMVYTEDYREEGARGSVLRVRFERQIKRWSTVFGFTFTNLKT